ncbi:MAG TPA: YggS family pyridoxal phosphate-dependent enzyme [Candidatus Avacidaminococcus intestinavium]|uniref:Pyridoxal phosphate homeostasis protein n=1 Tax=Candidatus Avacidaminococcus intestinavium TaxID=2840684 RepID=A0A9D1MND5_9FIRM|nr:YggS family pyridoxal phosphate-dependent enzyme [Candidatus Avacidaminococcus intestinavium]
MIRDNILAVRKRIDAAITKRSEAKITGNNVTLVAVTKNHDVSVIHEVASLGILNIGENKVQEAFAKKNISEAHNTIWHLLGHLQTNKVKQAVNIFDVIESVDSQKVMQAINKAAHNLDKVQDVLLQINLTGEEQKSGFSIEEYEDILPLLATYDHIKVRGLMIIAQQTERVEETRITFKKGYELFCSLQAKVGKQVDMLSMGMTHDYWVAVEEGANYVRIGTAIFGARDYSK